MDQDADLFGSVLVGEGNTLGRGVTLTSGMASLETCRKKFNTCCFYKASEKVVRTSFYRLGLSGFGGSSFDAALPSCLSAATFSVKSTICNTSFRKVSIISGGTSILEVGP